MSVGRLQNSYKRVFFKGIAKSKELCRPNLRQRPKGFTESFLNGVGWEGEGVSDKEAH